MNQEIGFGSAHKGQTDTVEFSESSFASSIEADLERTSLWNEKVNFWDIRYIMQRYFSGKASVLLNFCDIGFPRKAFDFLRFPRIAKEKYHAKQYTRKI